ncbi:unnamed protein product [Prorocentrum cordatum]|uniref:Uncharacterized protein n=1 Tax=Prorocentrum cordatum TaxID=2364126 RepID=A0ABN9V9E1_9DINO|nr:unnamed protein product [Polarella glacialis]
MPSPQAGLAASGPLRSADVPGMSPSVSSDPQSLFCQPAQPENEEEEEEEEEEEKEGGRGTSEYGCRAENRVKQDPAAYQNDPAGSLRPPHGSHLFLPQLRRA